MVYTSRYQPSSERVKVFRMSLTALRRTLHHALVAAGYSVKMKADSLMAADAKGCEFTIVVRLGREQDHSARILRVVADICQLPVNIVRGLSRARPPARARAIAIYVLRKGTQLSWPKIARLLGRSDHTTAIYAYRRIEAELIHAPNDLSRQIAAIELRIEQMAEIDKMIESADGTDQP
jgi:chromosomal replication initiation ATPase DnaA